MISVSNEIFFPFIYWSMRCIVSGRYKFIQFREFFFKWMILLMLSSSRGCPRCVLVIFIFALIDCFNWTYWKKMLFLDTIYISVSCWNVNKVLWSKMWWRCVMIFFHFVLVRGDVFAMKSGLYHMGVWVVVGENAVSFNLVINLLSKLFPPRVVAIAMFWKQLWCLIVSLINGWSLADMSRHSVYSIFNYGC